jgi:two-component system sensor histidine kinase KdpD
VPRRIFLPDEHEQLHAAEQKTGRSLSVDAGIAQWAFDRGEAAGIGTDTLAASPMLYLPLKAPARHRGVLVIEPDNARMLLIPEQRRQLDTFATLIAIALERVHFVTVARDTLLRWNRNGCAAPCCRPYRMICAHPDRAHRFGGIAASRNTAQ